MRQSKLFNRTRTSLALSYAGVMGTILSLLGFGVYEAISHAHWVALDSELESVAGTLHDSLELKLKQPGRLEPIVYELLPNLCLVGTSCDKARSRPKRHVLSAISQGNYYIRMFDTSGRLVAIAGTYPQGLPQKFNKELWQTLSDRQGNDYHQISVSLHTQDWKDWGYFQVGRNLKDFEDYLARVKWALKLGLPVSLIFVGGASWWLAGLAMRPIYKSYKQIEQFTADAAHELRTPLATSLATVESALLMPYLEDKDARDVLTTIKRQDRRLTQLVADLLLLARIDKKSMPLLCQKCCLNDLASDLVEEMASLALAARVTLTVEIPDATTLEVFGDLDQLYRLVSNLIVNAIQYTPASGTVKVILERNDRYALIRVRDTGIGIALSQQKKIFDRFYRVNSDRSRHTGGSGLGLAIAKAIALTHYGSLTVQSELGKGSTFTVQLPLAISSKTRHRKFFGKRTSLKK
jgi:signal transduction histidine kinase